MTVNSNSIDARSYPYYGGVESPKRVRTEIGVKSPSSQDSAEILQWIKSKVGRTAQIVFEVKHGDKTYSNAKLAIFYPRSLRDSQTLVLKKTDTRDDEYTYLKLTDAPLSLRVTAIEKSEKKVWV